MRDDSTAIPSKERDWPIRLWTSGNWSIALLSVCRQLPSLVIPIRRRCYTLTSLYRVRKIYLLCTFLCTLLDQFTMGYTRRANPLKGGGQYAQVVSDCVGGKLCPRGCVTGFFGGNVEDRLEPNNCER